MSRIVPDLLAPGKVGQAAPRRDSSQVASDGLLDRRAEISIPDTSRNHVTCRCKVATVAYLQPLHGLEKPQRAHTRPALPVY